MSVIKYKLINQYRTTRGGMEWPIGKTNQATGDISQGLCSDAALHCYDDPYLALFLNPIQANVKNPVVCEVIAEDCVGVDKQLKCGYRKMRVVRDLDIPNPTVEQRVEFGIKCALAVCDEAEFVSWANKWLSGEDRSTEAARAASWTAASAASSSASEAASAASGAASAASSSEAASAASGAASAASWASKFKVDLVSIAREVMIPAK